MIVIIYVHHVQKEEMKHYIIVIHVMKVTIYLILQIVLIKLLQRIIILTVINLHIICVTYVVQLVLKGVMNLQVTVLNVIIQVILLQLTILIIIVLK